MIEKLTEHYNNNRDKLAKQAGRRLNDAAYGQDCVQEAYMIALKYLDTYKPERGTFDQWFGRIYQRSISRYAAFIRDKGVTKEFNAKDVEIPFEDLLQKYPHLMRQCVDKLVNESHRKIMELYLKGYTGKDIQAMTGFSMQSVFQVIKRFKEKIAGYLA